MSHIRKKQSLFRSKQRNVRVLNLKALSSSRGDKDKTGPFLNVAAARTLLYVGTVAWTRSEGGHTTGDYAGHSGPTAAPPRPHRGPCTAPPRPHRGPCMAPPRPLHGPSTAALAFSHRVLPKGQADILENDLLRAPRLITPPTHTQANTRAHTHTRGG